MPKSIINHLSAVFQQAPVPMAIAVLDEAAREHLFQMVNAAFYEFFRVDPEQVVHQPAGRFLSASPDQPIELVEGENNSFPWGHHVVEATWIRGAEPPAVLFTVLPLVGEQQREDFIATLTHDLKTPIVGANMVLTALLDGSVGELQREQSEIIQKLKTSNQALLKMIQNLLEVYKYEMGREALRFDGANLAEIVSFCVADVMPLAEHKKIKLEVLLPKEQFLIICDEYAIKRVLINLLGNAVKFTPEGGVISVRASEDMDNAYLVIKDTGRGISSVDRARLFQRFWQGDPGRRYSAGTGLGLYFCYNVVKAHGGTIRCDSEPGQGTTFSIVLPKYVYAQ